MSRNLRKPKSRPPEPSPTAAETAGGILFFAGYAIRKTSWYVWALLAAVPVAGYLAYPYYKAWAIWNSTFETEVYNMNDENLGLFRTETFDNRTRIGAGGALPNSMSDGTDDYVDSRKITLYWNFKTRDHGHVDIEDYSKRTCYYKTLELPERQEGENTLLIGIYNKNVLRIRWGKEGFPNINVRDDGVAATEAWKHGLVPLSSNWAKNDPTNWPENTAWNEAIDGPAIDAQGKGAWLTLKADYSKPCEE